MSRISKALAWAAGLIGLAACFAAFAHHSFAGQFDRGQPVAFQGVVTKIEWQNPHVWFYVDAKDAEDNVIHWEAETTNPNTLLRRGWRHDDLKVGDQVSVEGFRAICCEHVMNATNVILPDGRNVFSRDGR